MIPDPKNPTMYIIPDYITFQNIFYGSYEPIELQKQRNSEQFRAINLD